MFVDKTVATVPGKRWHRVSKHDRVTLFVTAFLKSHLDSL